MTVERDATRGSALVTYKNSFEAADIPVLILDLGLDVVDGVGGLGLMGGDLSGECLDEDLCTTAKTKDEVECRLLLDVAVREASSCSPAPRFGAVARCLRHPGSVNLSTGELPRLQSSPGAFADTW